MQIWLSTDDDDADDVFEMSLDPNFSPFSDNWKPETTYLHDKTPFDVNVLDVAVETHLVEKKNLLQSVSLDSSVDNNNYGPLIVQWVPFLPIGRSTGSN